MNLHRKNFQLNISVRKRGFTLLEIMIGVAIVGVLASIAIPAFNKYIYEARRTEAVVMLNNVWKAEKSFHEEHGFYRASFTGNTPLPGRQDEGPYPSLLFSVPTSTLRYNLLVGDQGAGTGNTYDLASLGGTLAPSVPSQVNTYGNPGTPSDDSQIWIGAEGNIGASSDKMDALVMKNGNLYILCDSTKSDPQAEPDIAAEFMSNFGDISCSLFPQGEGSGGDSGGDGEN